jgi:hypothetical protein
MNDSRHKRLPFISAASVLRPPGAKVQYFGFDVIACRSVKSVFIREIRVLLANKVSKGVPAK